MDSETYCIRLTIGKTHRRNFLIWESLKKYHEKFGGAYSEMLDFACRFWDHCSWGTVLWIWLTQKWKWKKAECMNCLGGQKILSNASLIYKTLQQFCIWHQVSRIQPQLWANTWSCIFVRACSEFLQAPWCPQEARAALLMMFSSWIISNQHKTHNYVFLQHECLIENSLIRCEQWYTAHNKALCLEISWEWSTIWVLWPLNNVY